MPFNHLAGNKNFTKNIFIPVHNTKQQTAPKPLKSEEPDIPGRVVLRPGIKAARDFGIEINMNNAEDEEAPEEPLRSREEVLAEYEQMKLAYINEGEQAKGEAREWVQRLIETTHDDIRKQYAEAGKEIEEQRRTTEDEAYKTGYERGYNLGNEKGYNEGYNKGLRKCKDTLKELMTMLEQIPEVKEEMFKQYENDLFNAIFTISNKIIIDSLKQKDKNVIQKMLRQAAKSFRNSEYIKVSLSKLDVEEMGNADLDSLREIFRDGQHVEFEIVKDAPKGTLILDNGSEITDAGIATQLMMIEKLGKGKFRDKESNL